METPAAEAQRLYDEAQDEKRDMAKKRRSLRQKLQRVEHLEEVCRARGIPFHLVPAGEGTDTQTIAEEVRTDLQRRFPATTQPRRHSDPTQSTQAA